MVIKIFKEYINEGTIRQISPDKERAQDLFLESERKFNLLEETIQKMDIRDDNANDYVEYCYNIIMFLIRAKMLEKGYISSGQGAHEAEVAFARNFKLNDSEVRLLNQLRYFRNGILYYGKRFDKEYAEKIIKFTHKIYQLIKK
ncbi:HEPN domain-containing protein [Candidatus Woesearchaeota archaeon]|nr:HEPN domain-containing protein [Candidatus Woesearchaeota archaeon]